MKIGNRASKIKSAKGLIASATSMFTKAATEIDNANTILQDVKQLNSEERQQLINKITEIDKQRDIVSAEIAANNDLKKKLEPFLPKS